jgi:hypothetical protein
MSSAEQVHSTARSTELASPGPVDHSQGDHNQGDHDQADHDQADHNQGDHDQVQVDHDLTVPHEAGQHRVGHHRILAPIGSGSTGTVFRSIDERSGAVRALKLAHGSARGQNAALRREFALLFQLRSHAHDGVVRALEGGRIDGRVWYASLSTPTRPARMFAANH